MTVIDRLPSKPDVSRGWPDKVNGKTGEVAGIATGGERPGWHGVLDRLMGYESPGQTSARGRARAEESRRATEHHAREVGD